MIATKAGLTRSGPDKWAPVGRPEYLRQQLEMSLRRLRLERIDLYQLHRIDPSVPMRETSAPAGPAARGQSAAHRTVGGLTVEQIAAGAAAPRRSSACRTATTSPTANRARSSSIARSERLGIHPLVSAGGRGTGATGRSAGRDRARARGHARAAFDRMAAAPLAGDAADSRDVVGRAPRGERRFRGDTARRAGVGGARSGGAPIAPGTLAQHRASICK